MCKCGGLFVYRPVYKNVLIYLCVWLCVVHTYLRQVSGCGYFSVRAGAQLVRGLGGSILKQPSGSAGMCLIDYGCSDCVFHTKQSMV